MAADGGADGALARRRARWCGSDGCLLRRLLARRRTRAASARAAPAARSDGRTSSCGAVAAAALRRACATRRSARVLRALRRAALRAAAQLRYDAVCAKRGGARTTAMGLDPDLPRVRRLRPRGPSSAARNAARGLLPLDGPAALLPPGTSRASAPTTSVLPHSRASSAASPPRTPPRPTASPRAAPSSRARAAEFLACRRRQAVTASTRLDRRRQQDMRALRESRRGRHLRAFWRGLVSLLPGPPAPEPFCRRRAATAGTSAGPDWELRAKSRARSGDVVSARLWGGFTRRD